MTARKSTTKAADKTLDFVNFTPDDEAAAIRALVEEVTPDFIVMEGDLVTRFPDMQIIRTPLNVPYAALKPILESGGDASEQLEALHNFLGRDAENAVIREQSLFSVSATAEKYFKTWEKVQQVLVGESKRSSN